MRGRRPRLPLRTVIPMQAGRRVVLNSEGRPLGTAWKWVRFVYFCFLWASDALVSRMSAPNKVLDRHPAGVQMGSSCVFLHSDNRVDGESEAGTY